MIKQIQLRGISRTPSDRMSEDGGLSESLNMYMDTAESAPAFVPEDVTAGIGLPADITTDLVYVHKTSAYEHTLFVYGEALSYMNEGKITNVIALESGDRINKISSIGNSIIATGVKNTYYALYKEGVYIDLGTAVPFPVVNVTTTPSTEMETPSANLVGWAMDLYTSGSDFNDATEGTKGETRKRLSNNLHTYFPELVNTYMTNNSFAGPRFVRYALELFDGTLLSSIPLMVGDFPYLLSERRTEGDEITYSHSVSFSSYKINFKLEDKDFAKGWEDIVSSIKLYVSPPILPTQQEKLVCVTSFMKGDDRINATLNFASMFEDNEEIMLYSSLCHEVSAFPIFAEDKFRSEVYTEDYNNLCEGYTMQGSKEFDGTSLDSKPLLEKDDIQHFNTVFKSHSSYNGRLLGIAPISKLELSYPYFPYRDSSSSTDKRLVLEFLLQTDSGKVAVQKEMLGECNFNYIFFPDNRCYQVDVYMPSVNRKLSYEMKHFAFLKGAYYLDERLTTGGDMPSFESQIKSKGEEGELSSDVAYDMKGNYLYMSKLDNLFSIADENKYRFQSGVTGVAIASAALSQGQFGQFPLYVFTEDGIWVMETGADGSFVTSKPLSREVCTNPESITSIDNAVVFVTKKAVMMISGSQVANISAYMNGRHYTPNESAQNVIRKQEGFSGFIPAVTDEDPFMQFMQDAKVSYDYAGERLVFISPSNKDFHYVYKIDTQTWHKLSFDSFNIIEPLNSYPECYVRGSKVINLYWNNYDGQTDFTHEVTAVLSAFNYYGGLSVSTQDAEDFIYGKRGIDLSGMSADTFAYVDGLIKNEGLSPEVRATSCTRVYSLGMVLDASRTQETAKGILITRPFDLGMPDVYKSITNIRIRGDYDKENVKWFLQGSDNGRDFYTLTSLRGKSWKMFRIFILADLEPTERISWIDIDFEPRYNNRLR